MAEDKVQTKLKAKGQIKLKMPVLNNIDYVDVTRNKGLLKRYNGNELEGKKWREFQETVGKEFGSGKIYYNIFQKDGRRSSGITNAVGSTPTKDIIQLQDSSSKEVLKALQELNTKVSNKSEGIGVETLLQITRQGYDMQISFLNQQLVFKDGVIDNLNKEIESLESELSESGQNSNLSQLIEIGQKFLISKIGKPTITQLKDSDQSDIPQEILQILGTVDYSRISQENLDKIISILRQYISTFPLKGQ